MHIDHIWPYKLGGKTSLKNLTLACAICNLMKSDKPLTMEFMMELRPGFLELKCQKMEMNVIQKEFLSTEELGRKLDHLLLKEHLGLK